MKVGDIVMHKKSGIGIIVKARNVNSFFIKVIFVKDPHNAWNCPTSLLEVINVEEKI